MEETQRGTKKWKLWSNTRILFQWTETLWTISVLCKVRKPQRIRVHIWSECTSVYSLHKRNSFFYSFIIHVWHVNNHNHTYSHSFKKITIRDAILALHTLCFMHSIQYQCVLNRKFNRTASYAPKLKTNIPIFWKRWIASYIFS